MIHNWTNRLIGISDNAPQIIPSNQTTVPYPPNYSGPSESMPQPQTQYNANPNAVPQPEVRVVYQPMIYSLSPNPTKTTCPTCHANIKTSTMSDHQRCAHLCCILLCLFGWVYIHFLNICIAYAIKLLLLLILFLIYLLFITHFLCVFLAIVRYKCNRSF